MIALLHWYWVVLHLAHHHHHVIHLHLHHGHVIKGSHQCVHAHGRGAWVCPIPSPKS